MPSIQFKRKALALSVILAFSSFVVNASQEYQVKSGEHILGILRSSGFEGDYKTLLPVLEQVASLNSARFAVKSLDLVYPNEALLLPDSPVIKSAEPEPIPEPETVVIAVPEIVPEPEVDYIGVATVLADKVKLRREQTQQELSGKIDVLENDNFTTNESGGIELTLADDSQYKVGPSSSFSVDIFQYKPSLMEKFTAKLNLIAGALSIKSGKVGKGRGDSYQLITSTATLGIRGTDYTVRVCEGSECGDLVGTTAAVKDGTIFVATADGPIDVQVGEFVQIETKGAAPIVGDIPEGFFDLNLKPSDVKKSWWQKVTSYVKSAIN